VFGVKWALAINAISYVFSYFAIRSVRLASDAPPNLPEAPMADVEQQISSLRADFVAGLRFFMGSRLLIALLAMAVTAALGTGALVTLGVFFVADNLNTPAHFFGFLAMAFGVGAIVGSLCSARAVRWLGARTLTWLGLLTAGVLVLLYARQTTLLGGVILYGLVSIPVAMLNTAITPLLLKSAPPEFLGRVVAVFNPVIQLASMLSVVVAGWLASSVLLGFHAQIAGIHFGAIDLIYTGAGLLIIAAALCGSVALPHDQAGETVQAAEMDVAG
jgi:Na+/melibiose symporter-like transporter